MLANALLFDLQRVSLKADRTTAQRSAQSGTLDRDNYNRRARY